MFFFLPYCDSEVGRSLAWLSSFPLALKGHGDLLWLVLVQQGKTLKQLLLCRHLLGLTCNCNPKDKTSLHYSKGNVLERMCTVCH